MSTGAADDGKWDVEDGRRPRRANRGTLLQELLEKGLNSEEENLLNDLSDATTDSTFSSSGEEAMDEIDSDFSDEEVEGVLDGTEVTTEAMLRREEREERQKERQRARRRMGGNVLQRKGAAAADAPKTAALRLRPPSTIPLEERLQMAHKRAREVRAAAAAASVAKGEHDSVGTMLISSAGGASAYNVGHSVAKRRRLHGSRARPAATPAGFEEGEEVPQRLLYTSSRSVLEQFGVPVVISFSTCLPRMFQT
ncbi:hypothetical protein C3747_11g468 [Trypanosoma cruzi]|uniref:Vps72/YL1 N-terminal domain-containing protein n=2 Tax=Trypanosoma cruzi TaxID=5693 RepID=Q4DM76_TRYCC|nr:hypothetical protein, conserved [Trypanosoma cruzi]EAN93617.1 hypothetical protein, conserved [Trypanosoma cruzi]KAF5223501.1 hypothetical protein ECC02_003520 [Trypanosoma cruzi]KAF8297251.1 putative YL1 nuclear protein [Trypanosoma cruzi]PWV19071.1 hypothetical protein C3747_11g468 [Trypanosoma cruzi]RNC54818.1 hypothetical protein TcCL_ESM07743 [Trypanosoma cruzi]|eukprot:XP_815468.1 hypothetical protein [Trypanosoma cruzi strain CL Brener]